MTIPSTKLQLHPRNKHRASYDFAALTEVHPALSGYLKQTPYGVTSIDFSDPRAVKALNQALLHYFYAISFWDIPPNYLCPPIPGRADYVHYLADLIAETPLGRTKKEAPVRILDVGVGANTVYPLIGVREYSWTFVGVDIDPQAIRHAQQIIIANQLESYIQLRLQPQPNSIFKGVIQPDDWFTATLCNPPFHASMDAAMAGSERKWRGLQEASTRAANSRAKRKSTGFNFGGQYNELVCKGGEQAFITQMIQESQQFAKQCGWFSTLVSKAAHLPSLYHTLKRVSTKEVRTIEMAQGQKLSRIVAWRF